MKINVSFSAKCTKKYDEIAQRYDIYELTRSQLHTNYEQV